MICKKTKTYDFIIVGGGILGLSVAYKLSNSDKSVLILEKEKDVCNHQSGRNSGVIHSGIYYTPGSLKAKNCISGYKQLLSFCEINKIDYKLKGKLIVATKPSELDYLDKIYENGKKNGLNDIKYVNEVEIKAIEPKCKGIKGIYVPGTGIINYKNVCKKIIDLIKSSSNDIIYDSKVSSITQNSKDEIVTVTCLSQKQYFGKKVICCAGLYSDELFKMTSTGPIDFKIVPFKGEYYNLTVLDSNYNQTLIYPVPNPKFPFLGVHITPNLKNKVEAGPNALLSFSKESYNKFKINFNEFFSFLFFRGLIILGLKNLRFAILEKIGSISSFYYKRSINKIFDTKNIELTKGRVGIRAQALSINGELIDDFKILNHENVIHVCNAPSPAATSSFAIADEVIKRIEKK